MSETYKTDVIWVNVYKLRGVGGAVMKMHLPYHIEAFDSQEMADANDRSAGMFRVGLKAYRIEMRQLIIKAQ